MSKEIERHERYKLYAQNSYKYEKTKLSSQKDIFPYGFQQNSETGFFGYALVEKDRVVIIFRGTDRYSNDTVGTDYKNDIFMVLNKIPEQLTDALNFYDDIKSKFPNKKIDVTGHSLGGSLAQYVAIMRNINEAVCFCPVGIGPSMENYLSKYGSKTSQSRIINYNNPNDIWTKSFRNKLFGTNYLIEGLDKDGDMHSLENMKPLSNRKNTYKNYNLPKENLNSSSNCTGSYTVQGYTRSDGTKVREYIRTCGKHNKMSMEERVKGQAKYKGKRFQDIPVDELEEAIGYFV